MRPEVIRAARAGLGWSQEQLAQEAGVHQKSVAYWERGGGGPGARSRTLPAMQAAFAKHGVVIVGQAIHFPGEGSP